jgi:hypothetical protein
MSNFRIGFMVLPLIFALNINAQAVGMLEEIVVTAQKEGRESSGHSNCSNRNF